MMINETNATSRLISSRSAQSAIGPVKVDKGTTLRDIGLEIRLIERRPHLAKIGGSAIGHEVPFAIPDHSLTAALVKLGSSAASDYRLFRAVGLPDPLNSIYSTILDSSPVSPDNYRFMDWAIVLNARQEILGFVINVAGGDAFVHGLDPTKFTKI